MDAVEQAEEKRIEAQEERESKSEGKLSNTAGYDPAVSEGDVITKPYSQQKFKNQATVNAPLPEPADFEPPPPYKEEPQEKKPDEPINPELADLPEDEKKASAETAANVALGVYRGMWSLPGKWLQISPKKAQTLHKKGDINLNLLIPHGTRNELAPMAVVINEFNVTVSDAFNVDPEFDEKVHPLLVKIFMKKSFGLTPEHELGFYLLQDSISKLAKVKDILLNQRDLIDALKDHTAAVKAQNEPVHQQAPPPPPPPPAPEQPAEQVKAETGKVVILNPEPTAQKRGSGRRRTRVDTK